MLATPFRQGPTCHQVVAWCCSSRKLQSEQVDALLPGSTERREEEAPRTIPPNDRQTDIEAYQPTDRPSERTNITIVTATMPPRWNIPPVTRILLGALVLQSVLSAAVRYRQWSAHSEIVVEWLTLVPQLSLFYPWTFVTTTLVENNIFTLSIAAVALYHGGRYLERAWSSREFAKFLLVVSLIPNILTFLALILFFSVTRNERWT